MKMIPSDQDKMWLDLRKYQAQVEPAHRYGHKALRKTMSDANLDRVLTSGQLFLIEDALTLAFLHGVLAGQGAKDIEP